MIPAILPSIKFSTTKEYVPVKREKETRIYNCTPPNFLQKRGISTHVIICDAELGGKGLKEIIRINRRSNKGFNMPLILELS